MYTYIPTHPILHGYMHHNAQAYMIHGQGAKSYNFARAWFYKYPKESHELLQLITDVTIVYLIEQVRKDDSSHDVEQ